MAEHRIKTVAMAALGCVALATGARGDPARNRFQILSTRISYKPLGSTPSGETYGIDGVAYIANGTDGSIHLCMGRFVLRPKDTKKSGAGSLDITGEPLKCHVMTYDKPAPDPLDSDVVFGPVQSKADEKAYMSFFRLSQTFAAITFCTTVDEKRVRCTPTATLR